MWTLTLHNTCQPTPADRWTRLGLLSTANADSSPMREHDHVKEQYSHHNMVTSVPSSQANKRWAPCRQATVPRRPETDTTLTPQCTGQRTRPEARTPKAAPGVRATSAAGLRGLASKHALKTGIWNGYPKFGNRAVSSTNEGIQIDTVTLTDTELQKRMIEPVHIGVYFTARRPVYLEESTPHGLQLGVCMTTGTAWIPSASSDHTAQVRKHSDRYSGSANTCTRQQANDNYQ